MPYLSHSFLIEDAIARNNEVYEVEFESWGVRSGVPGLVMPQENLQYPPPNSRPIPASVAIAAIGPRSTVDHCWITWDRQKLLAVSHAHGFFPGEVISLPRVVTVDAPLLFPQVTRGQPSLPPATQSWWDAMQSGTAYAFPWGPRPGNNGAPQGAGELAHGGLYGTTTGFYAGQTYVALDGAVLQFDPDEEPFLQLLLYPKPPIFAPPTRRATMARTRIWDTSSDVLPFLFPIFGRKHVSVSFISHNFNSVAAQVCDFTVGLIRNVNEGTDGLEKTPLFEVKGAEALGVAANTGVNLQINNPCADYVTVRIHSAALAAGGAFTMVAED